MAEAVRGPGGELKGAARSFGNWWRARVSGQVPAPGGELKGAAGGLGLPVAGTSKRPGASGRLGGPGWLGKVGVFKVPNARLI